MSLDTSEDFVAIREVIASACPETKANGIYEAEHADKIPWDDYNPPYVVMHIAELEAIDMGPLVDAFKANVDIYYVAPANGPHTKIRAALARIGRAFNNWPQEKLQVEKIGAIRWGDTIESNKILSTKSSNFGVGCITVELIVGAPLDPFPEA